MSQTRILTLTCVNCGGKLEVSPDMNRFACGYCGTEQVVERRGGTVALKGLTDAISRVQTGTDKTAAELALNRLNGEWLSLNQHQTQLQTQAAAEGKGHTSVMVILIVVFTIAAGAILPEDHSKGASTEIAAGLALLIGGWTFAIAVKVLQDRRVQSRLRGDLEQVDSHRQELQRKIEANRKFVG